MDSSSIGSLYIVTVMVTQSFMFVINGIFKLSLPMEQLYFPIVVVMVVALIGVIIPMIK